MMTPNHGIRSTGRPPVRVEIAQGNLQLRFSEFRDDLLRSMLLRSWHQNALLQLRPIARIIVQVMDSFEGGRSHVLALRPGPRVICRDRVCHSGVEA